MYKNFHSKKELKEVLKKNDWVANNLNGKVKSTITLKHNLIVKNGKVIKNKDTYALDRKTYECFDLQGNMERSLVFDDREIRTVLFIPSYNSNNYVKSYKYYDSQDKLMSECLMQYLDSGNAIEDWGSSGKNSRDYNLQKNTIVQLNYDTEDNLIWKDTYKYDSNENLIEFCNDLSKTISVFNLFGNCIEEIEYDLNDNFLKRRIFNYKLDKNNNWIEKIEFLMVNNIEIPQTILERKIAYYK